MTNIGIELTETEVMPDITHIHICAWKFEVPRPSNNNEGFIEVWIAKCYREEGVCVEDQRYVGNMIRIDGEEFDEFISIPTTAQNLLSDSVQILAQFLIDKGYIDGTVVSE